VTTSRKLFLEGLFRSLEADGVRYCVLRNYDNIFADTTSDIDLIIEKRDLIRFKTVLRAAAAAAGQRFVHRARYVNYSYVFWDPQGGFIRIDFETELRWRIFPVLSAAVILDARQKQGDFYVPHPRHESAVLFGQVAWRGSLSDRYRRQLARLYADCGDARELALLYGAAFGGIGAELAKLHSHILDVDFNAALCARLRRSLITKAATRPAAMRACAANVATDARRLWERLRKPAGISLLFASSAGQDHDFAQLVRRLEFLFPEQKCFIQVVDFTAGGNPVPGLDPGLNLRRLRTLFKGGLFVRFYRLAHDTDLRRVIRTHPRLLYSSRAFFCLEDSSRRACLAHVRTGCMAESGPVPADGENGLGNLLIEFISTILEKERQPGAAQKGRRGLSVVLVGLDGSGKTTLARNLARLTATDARFDGMRYYHWRPKIFNALEFPLPDFSETPRKPPLPKTPLNSALSALRLVKNVLVANLAAFVRVRPLLRRNCLVLTDRYFFNYRLDPASVKYAGPPWLLQALLPLFPRPDLVVTLEADAATLLARKRELSPEEIARQIALVRDLDLHGARRLSVDASQPADAVARATLAAITAADVQPPVGRSSR
jgi:thymidylate kinase